MSLYRVFTFVFDEGILVGDNHLKGRQPETQYQAGIINMFFTEPYYYLLEKYCQAQPQLNSTQLKLRLSVSLISTLIQPPTRPPTRPPGHPPSHPEQ